MGNDEKRSGEDRRAKKERRSGTDTRSAKEKQANVDPDSIGDRVKIEEMKRTLENDDEGAGHPCRGLHFSDRIRSKPITQKRQEAAARSGNAESANGLQARRDS